MGKVDVYDSICETCPCGGGEVKKTVESPDYMYAKPSTSDSLNCKKCREDYELRSVHGDLVLYRHADVKRQNKLHDHVWAAERAFRAQVITPTAERFIERAEELGRKHADRLSFCASALDRPDMTVDTLKTEIKRARNFDAWAREQITAKNVRNACKQLDLTLPIKQLQRAIDDAEAEYDAFKLKPAYTYRAPQFSLDGRTLRRS